MINSLKSSKTGLLNRESIFDDLVQGDGNMGIALIFGLVNQNMYPKVVYSKLR